jgi:hypothetical protein
MARLWITAAPLPMIGGLYLILGGLGRFVEEAYRGEPQTRILFGLRLYQWLAILSVVLGAAITAIGEGGNAGPFDAPSLEALIASAILGVLSGLALGVDFPESNRRFARLA